MSQSVFTKELFCDTIIGDYRTMPYFYHQITKGEQFVNNQKKNSTVVDTNILLWICIFTGAVFLAFYALIDIFSPDPPIWLGPLLAATYVLVALVSYIICRKKLRFEKTFKEETITMEKAMTSMMKDVEIPCVLTLRNGIIAWCSHGAYEMFGASTSLLQKNFNDLSGVKLDDLVSMLPEDQSDSNDTAEERSMPVIIGEKNYMARIYRKSIGKNSYYLITFSDYTDYARLFEKTENEYPVIAYVVLDNLEEIAQYVRVNYRSAANDIEIILKDFAEKLNGFIKEYDRDKYIMMFHKEKYDECAENKFEILETVRNVRLGDSSVPVTISIGISLVGDTFAEREKNAAAALETALQRGGDQVVVKTKDEALFFGGRTKGVQKKSGSFARVFATQLTSQIASAGNVLIMGHANPDFDSIGSCIGVARLCFFCGISPKIIIDENNTSFNSCTEKLCALDEYRHVFISGEEGLDLIRSDTLLIITDANNFKILEAPDIAENVQNIVIIDHHRKTVQFEHEPLLSHIDPSASSASEMVTEILEQCLAGESLLKEEANVLLAGIMVDTKNFTRSTGTKTFSAAMYLRSAGGSSEVAGAFFNENFNDFISEAKFTSNVTMYRDRIAITQSDGNDPSFDRIAASKAADKLLTVKNVDAAFALVQIGNAIHISARSNGSINVQLILERLNGGGHFDVAGAQVKDSNMKQTLLDLKDAIDDYLEKN